MDYPQNEKVVIKKQNKNVLVLQFNSYRNVCAMCLAISGRDGISAYNIVM